MSGNHPAVDASWRMEGASSAKFIRADAQYMYIPDAALEAGFPCRSADAAPVKTWSFAGWLRVAAGGLAQTLASKWHADDGKRNYQFRLSDAASPAASMDLGFNAGASEETKAHATGLTLLEPYWVAFCYQDSDKAWAIRVRDKRGRIVGTDAAGTAVLDENKLSSSDAAFQLGVHGDAGNPFGGNLDDWRVYSGQFLSEEEATEIAKEAAILRMRGFGRMGQRIRYSWR